LGIVDKDLNTFFGGLRELPEVERKECINDLLVRYGTHRLRMRGYDDKEIGAICKRIADNINYVIAENITVSVEEIFEFSIEAWQKAEDEIKGISMMEETNLGERKRILDACRKFIAGGAIALYDLANLVETRHYAAAISLISSAMLLSDIVFYRR